MKAICSCKDCRNSRRAPIKPGLDDYSLVSSATGRYPFISDEDAMRRSRSDAWPITDFASHQMMVDVVNVYRNHFKSAIDFQEKWNSEIRNFFAKFPEGGQRIVEIHGGLVRIKSFKAEGIALMIAHEVGHHFGGAPKDLVETWRSCEGQADYYAVSVMREVFGVSNYINMTRKAIRQVTKFFGAFSPILGISGCAHPSYACRIDIFNAALNGDPMPVCGT
ncbi:MAG TPA: hypothetical protein VD993_15540 [Chitinophagaceae bacterium]|nr:hypothetical protein [Chitinophagaceae bacterium]